MQPSTTKGPQDEHQVSDPAATSDALFTRDEVLRGFPARRAQTLLFLIERSTARHVAQWQVLVTLSSMPEAGLAPALLGDEFFRAAEPVDRNDPTGLSAYAQGRDSGLRPSIRDIERYAPEWAALVPANPRLRATVIHLMCRKYRVVYDAVPRLRAALGLDEPAVQQAYQQLYGQPLESIFAPRITTGERLRSVSAAPVQWVESLSPFWMAFLLMLALPLPQGALATPIATADIGFPGGIVVLIIVGLLNVVTIGYVAGAAARSGTTRAGNASLVALAANFTGRTGSLAITGSTALFFVLGLLVSFVGFSSTLDSITGIPAWVWLGALFLLGLAVLSREAPRLTSVMLAVSAVSIGLILIVSLLTFSQLQSGNLTSTPFGDGTSFGLSSLDRLIGVALVCVFGHVLVSQTAATVLQRHPDPRSLVRGSIAGTICLLVVLAVWTTAVSGAVDPALLRDARESALAPLSDQVGLGVNVLGAVLAILIFGMASVRSSVVLAGLIRERLPSSMTSPPADAATGTDTVSPTADTSSGKYGPLLLVAVPLVAVFVLALILEATRDVSFATLLGFTGVITVSVFGGIVPPVLFVAARRKGETPTGPLLGPLSHPAIAAAISTLFLANLFAHGLFIWDNAAQRAAALLAGVLALGAVALIIRDGGLAERVVLEIRRDGRGDGGTSFSVLAGGEPLTSAFVQLPPDDGQDQRLAVPVTVPLDPPLRVATVHIPATKAQSLKVWTHRVAEDGAFEPLPAELVVRQDDVIERADMQLANGQVLVPSRGEEALATITFAGKGDDT